MGDDERRKCDLPTVPQPLAVPQPMIVFKPVEIVGEAVTGPVGVTVSILSVVCVTVTGIEAVIVFVTVTVGLSPLPPGAGVVVLSPGSGVVVLSTPDVIMPDPVALTPGG